MGKSRKSKSAKGGRKNSVPAAENPNSLVYKGPLFPRASMQANHVDVVRLVFSTQVTASASGNIYVVTTNNPGSATDFAAYAGLYTEFRVIASRVQWVPIAQGFQSGAQTNVQQPVVVYSSRGDNTFSAPSNFANAYDNDGAKVHNIGKQFSVTMRMSGDGDSAWGLTLSPGLSWCIYVYSNGLTASAAYGYTFCDYLVQFRGRY